MSGHNRARPWDAHSFQSGQTPRISPNSQNAPTLLPLQSPSRQLQPSTHDVSNRTLPPIHPHAEPPSLRIAPASRPVLLDPAPPHHRQQSYEQTIEQPSSPLDTAQSAQTPSPKRRRLNSEHSHGTFAYAKWLESASASSRPSVIEPNRRNSVGHDNNRVFARSVSRGALPLQPMSVDPGVEQDRLRRTESDHRERPRVETLQQRCNDCGRCYFIAQELVTVLVSLDETLRTAVGSSPTCSGTEGTKSIVSPNFSGTGMYESLEWAVNLAKEDLALAKIPLMTLHQQYRIQDEHAHASEKNSLASLSHSGPSTMSTHATTLMPAPNLLPRQPLSTEPDTSNIRSPATRLSESAHAAHLSDLQHQVATKSLGLQTLQQEQDHLISAYSRSQTRCAALERKFQASDAEINNLTEERIKLCTTVEGLESQVEDLIAARDDARKQSVANGGQYMKIMAMASRLEAQGAADKRRWRDEQETWLQEKATLDSRVQQLERERIDTTKVGNCSPDSDQVDSEASEARTPVEPRLAEATHLMHVANMQHLMASPFLESATSVPRTKTSEPPSASDEFQRLAESNKLLEDGSLDDLREEVRRLRQGWIDMDGAISDLKSEGQRIDQVMRKFGNVGKRVTAKADQIRAVSSTMR